MNDINFKDVIKQEIINSDVYNKLDKYDVAFFATNITNRVDKMFTRVLK